MVEGPQDYVQVDAALPKRRQLPSRPNGPGWSKTASTSARRRRRRIRVHPEVLTTCTANSKGLFAYYQYAEASFILTCRTPDGGGSGWRLTGIKTSA